ncbi:MAG: hypothetical protein ACFCUN_13595 [Hyphomicrobiaceae bacterium]
MLTFSAIICSLVGSVIAGASTAAAQAQNDNRVFHRFGSSGNWLIQAATISGQFNHCEAVASYQSGTRVGIIARANGDWILRFWSANFPNRSEQEFPVILLVDNRTVLNGNGLFSGQDVFITLGQSLDRIQAIMRGRVMTIRTNQGADSFSLRGTNAATQMVARCFVSWSQRAPVASGGGAFGPGRTPNQSAATGQRKLDRAETMEYAVRYLAGATERYEILAADRNIFTHFPVNWRYANGVVGGLMVLARSDLAAVAGLDRLLADHTTTCRGRNAIERRPISQSDSGLKIAIANGACEDGGKVTTSTYSAIELGNQMIALVVEWAEQQGVDPPESSVAAPPSTRPGLVPDDDPPPAQTRRKPQMPQKAVPSAPARASGVTDL